MIPLATSEEISSYLDAQPLTPAEVLAILEFTIIYDFGMNADPQTEKNNSSPNAFYEYFKTLH